MKKSLVFCLLALTSCGACEDDTPPLEEQDTTVRVEPDRPTETLCGGCTNEAGDCLDGDSVDACGVGGVECTPCVGDEACLADGSCGAAPACGPDVCDGCCDAAGVCVDGAAATACGIGGGACISCGDGTACSAGVCAEVCGPGNCNGCCDATGACVGGSAEAACGIGGGACADCTATGASCNAGGCVDTGCAATCAGCCAGDACVMSPSATQCGANGGACVACGAGDVCTAGMCQMPPMTGRWNLIAVSAEVAPSKPNGSSWDPAGGAPDPYIEIASADSSTSDLWYDYSSTRIDTYSPVWNEVILAGVTTQALMEGVEFFIGDDEFNVDEICYDLFTIDPTTQAGQDVTTICVGDPRTTWTWRLEPAP